jgi:hypothetical protein
MLIYTMLDWAPIVLSGFMSFLAVVLAFRMLASGRWGKGAPWAIVVAAFLLALIGSGESAPRILSSEWPGVVRDLILVPFAISTWVLAKSLGKIKEK